MKQKILYLPLKAKWYEMIEIAVKKEEYREIKPYWTKRLVNPDGTLKRFDFVVFTYGYTKRKMVVQCKHIYRGGGVHAWGAVPFQEYYVISLGRIISSYDSNGNLISPAL